MAAVYSEVKRYLWERAVTHPECCVCLRNALWVVRTEGRIFDKDTPRKDTLAFNHQVFGEDKDIVAEQYPEDLPRSRCKMKSTLPGIKADRLSQKIGSIGSSPSFTT